MRPFIKPLFLIDLDDTVKDRYAEVLFIYKIDIKISL